MIQLDLNLHKAQSLAMTAPAEEILYGGAAGGGKSHLIRTALITYCLAVKGLQCFLFRRTYPELKMNHMEGAGSFPEMLQPLVEAKDPETGRQLCRIVDKDILFHNGSRIKLRHLQHARELTNYQGAEIHVLAMDEATHFTDAEYRYLRGRMRVVGLKIPEGLPWAFPRALLGTNPGGIGHHWAKGGFVNHGPYHVHRATKADGGMRRVYIPAKMEDNPSLLAADPTYVDRLEGLGDQTLVRSLKDGDWEVVAGAMYGAVWRRDRHLVQPFAIPNDWRIWTGGDDGFAAPSCIYWLTQDPKIGTYYVIRELYGSKLMPETIADKMEGLNYRIMMSGRRIDSPPVPNEEPIQGLYDSSAFAEKGESKRGGRGDQINEALKRLNAGRIRAVDKWQGSRVHGCQKIHRLLGPNPDDPSGMPGLRIFDGYCPNLVRTLPTLGRDPGNPEDVNTDEDDHSYDALRYALQWRDKKVIGRRTTGR